MHWPRFRTWPRGLAAMSSVAPCRIGYRCPRGSNGWSRPSRSSPCSRRVSIELGAASTTSVPVPLPADDFWTGPIVPLDEPGQPPRKKDTQVDVAARRAVLWERLAIDRCDDADDVTRLRRARLESAIVRGFGHPWFASAPAESLQLRYPGSSFPMSLPLRVDVLMRALTGTLARAVPGVESRHLLAAQGVDYCEPMILTGSGLGIGWSLVTRGERHAVFTPKFAERSVLVDADGRLSEGTSLRRSWSKRRGERRAARSRGLPRQPCSSGRTPARRSCTRTCRSCRASSRLGLTDGLLAGSDRGVVGLAAGWHPAVRAVCARSGLSAARGG